MEPITSSASPEEKLYSFFNEDADKDKHNIYRAFNGHKARKTFEGLNASCGFDDLKAMSVASLYEGDNSTIEMNTVRPDDSKSIGSSPNLYWDNDARIVPIAMPLNQTEEIVQPVAVESNEYPCNPYGETPYVNSSLYFADGIRSVDFVLVWKVTAEEQIHLEEVRQSKRFTFEQNLIRDGLELEQEVIENEIHFIKIHAPLEVLRRYSEILKLRMPMKESLCVVKNSDKLSRLASAAQFISHKVCYFQSSPEVDV